MIKCFLTPDGKKLFPDATQREYDHADVARTILKSKGIAPKDYEDTYNQMFRLGYARMVEFNDRIYIENTKRALTKPQIAFIEMEKFDKGKAVYFNDKLFETTRCGGVNAHHIVQTLIGPDTVKDV